MSGPTRLKHIARLKTETMDDTPRPLIALENLQSGTGTLISEAALCDFVPAKAGTADVATGDVLFGKLRPYLAKTWVADRPARASTELLCMHPSIGIDSRWLGYVATSMPFVEWAVATSDGTKMPRTSWERLGDFRLNVPSFNAQRAIADYLDHETARIDALIAAKRRMVELLEEHAWASFMRHVLKSKPPTVQLRRSLTTLIDGPFGSAFSSSDYTDDGAIVVRLGNIGFSQWRDNGLAYIPMNLYETFAPYRVEEGDLLIAGLGDDRNHAGRACVAPDFGPAIVKGKCFRGRVDRSIASAEYLALLLSSPMGAEAMAISGRGSTRSMINLDIVKGTEISLPALPEQEAIVHKTRADQTRTCQTVAALGEQMALLQERRQALITAAVTGQLDIPGAA